MIKTGVLFPNSKITVILASAGAGKTHEVLRRFSFRVKKVPPARVALVTFTRKGVETAMSRIIEQHPMWDEDDLEYVKTLHSMCFRALGIDYQQLWSARHELFMNTNLGTNVHRKYAPEHATRDNLLLDQYDLERNGGTTDPGITESMEYRRLVQAYENVKKHMGAIDFTDCLQRFVEEDKPLPVEFAFIDEAQDLTDLQWDVCNVAFRNCKNVTIAGDDYQTIFSYAGANPKVLINLAGRGRLIKLEVSHRIPHSVYKLAKSITDMMAVKIDKDYQPDTDREGKVQFLPGINSLKPYIQKAVDESWYILTRNSVFQDKVAEMLTGMVLPYTKNGGFCVPLADLTLLRQYYSFRKIGYGSKESRENFMTEYHLKSFEDDIIDTNIFPPEKAGVYQNYIDKYGIDRLYNMSKGAQTITLSNVHRVKGGEADNVAILLDCTGRIEGEIDDDKDAELRVLYVAVTRAKNNLYLIHAEQNGAWDSLLEDCMRNTLFKGKL